MKAIGIILIVLGAIFYYFTHSVIATLGFILAIVILGIKLYERMDF